MPRISSKIAAQYSSSLLTDQDAARTASTAYAKLAAKKYVKDNDKNKDGSLTQDEVTLSQEAFDRLDQDKSKALSQEEMQVGLAGNEDALSSYFAKGSRKLMKTSLLRSFAKYF